MTGRRGESRTRAPGKKPVGHEVQRRGAWRGLARHAAGAIARRAAGRAVISRLAIRASLACGVLALALSSAQAQLIVKTVDRKFPTGKYCPLESRAAAGVNLAFTAPAATVRITFSTNNFRSGTWSAVHVDNVVVVAKSVFDTHLLSPSPDYDDCYNPSIPPGQTTPGILNAPSYDFNAGGTTEVLLDQFASNVSGWSGPHLTFDGASNAPNAPTTGDPPGTGGSLLLGGPGDGAVVVSASKIVSGLTAGQQYVVHVWWTTLNTDPLTITIGRPCADADGDGYVTCGACDLQPGEVCGDCNPANAHCTSNCTDHDGDGWCVTSDCNDNAASCTSNCATDVDTDGIPDCRDTCLDADRDGYGTAGGGGAGCTGSDCNDNNRYCNTSCVDGDGDGRCQGVDCNDANPAVGNDLSEINDCLDQQCPGDRGFGVVDETSGNSGFLNQANKNLYSWPPQAGATSYEAARSSSRTFTTCTTTVTGSTSWNLAGNPPVGTAYYFLNHPVLPCKGSWGQKSNGQERSVICGRETNCTNGLDDDSDGSADCADSDCSGTATCRVQTFAFTDTTGNDIADNALFQFFQTATASATDYIYFDIFEPPTRRVSWCSVNAAFYRSNYLSKAPTFGTATSGSWNKWRKAPVTGNAWQGPDTAGHLNTFGNDCFGDYSWCSEQFSPEPQNSIFPNRTNDCEIYDLATGFCSLSTGTSWQLTIRIASTRLLACGF